MRNFMKHLVLSFVLAAFAMIVPGAAYAQAKEETKSNPKDVKKIVKVMTIENGDTTITEHGRMDCCSGKAGADKKECDGKDSCPMHKDGGHGKMEMKEMKEMHGKTDMKEVEEMHGRMDSKEMRAMHEKMMKEKKEKDDDDDDEEKEDDDKDEDEDNDDDGDLLL